jgi:hypothetical protein
MTKAAEKAEKANGAGFAWRDPGELTLITDPEHTLYDSRVERPPT